MSLHPLKLTDDEAQALITRAFRETGYRLDRRDPVIVQYVVQKFLLKDFDEKQRETFSEFTERIIPAIKTETTKMEEQKKRLWEWSRNAAREIVDQSGEEYARRIREVIRTTDNAMLENLDKHIVRLRGERSDTLTKLKEQNQMLTDTAALFKKSMTRIFGGSVIAFSILVFLMLYFYGR